MIGREARDLIGPEVLRGVNQHTECVYDSYIHLPPPIPDHCDRTHPISIESYKNINVQNDMYPCIYTIYIQTVNLLIFLYVKIHEIFDSK